MVCRELCLVAARVPLRGAGGAGAVDQDVKRSATAEPIAGEGVDRYRVDQVEPPNLDSLQSGQRRTRSIRIPRADRDPRAGLRQRPGDLQADARVTSRPMPA